MQASPYRYQFTSNNTASLLAHEALPLQLLEIMNRGTPRPADGQIRLRPSAHGQLALHNLSQNRIYFALPSLAIEGNSLVLHFGESHLAHI
jgi:hypothetical protein